MLKMRGNKFFYVKTQIEKKSWEDGKDSTIILKLQKFREFVGLS